MRAPHNIPTHPPANTYANPYDELRALDDGPEGPDGPDGPLEEALQRGSERGSDSERGFERGPEEDESWAPPHHGRSGRSSRGGSSRRRKRGRFAGLPFALKAVCGLVVLAAFLTLADRWALLYAEGRAADTLKDRMKLSAAPEVEIGGFPFLTQVADKRLESVRLTVPDVAADRVSLARVTATAHDVHLDADGLTAVRGADIPRLDGEVLLSFDDLNRELGASQVTFTGQGRDRVLARGTLPVAGHDLKLRADARIRRDGEQGIATEIGGMRLDIGDLATYRPGTSASEGLHLTRGAAAALAHETRKAKALLGVPSVVRSLGVPDSDVREAQRSDSALSRLTGRPSFVRQAMGLNLVDLALEQPELLQRLGFDPALLDALPRLTRPVLADQLSLGFEVPEPERGQLRLRDVRVREDGIQVRIEGSGLAVGGS
ncbi:DUF2993 domain-containing protein [Streptomyces sp. NPDC050997]|uniref:LmeA family phospholipid-binding protein n=1 Tax=Streptomyces sp. NPDC050997 TaxID=3155519 RepID=UPI0034175790